MDVQERTVTGHPSGFTDAPDPLPNIEAFAELVAKGEISNIASEDGALNYRAFAWVTDTEEIGIWAVPLGEIDKAVNDLVQR